MVLNATQQLSNLLGNMQNQIDMINEDGFAEEVSTDMLITPFEGVIVTHTLIVKGRNYTGDGFVLGHPIYGSLGSSSYPLGVTALESSTTTLDTYNS